MLLDDCVESLLIFACSEPYVVAGHPDFIAIEGFSAWIRHTELVVFDFPDPNLPATRFIDNTEDAIRLKERYPMVAVDDILADKPFTYFALAKAFETLLR